jgi:chemotaxis protein methyltransferase CheR
MIKHKIEQMRLGVAALSSIKPLTNTPVSAMAPDLPATISQDKAGLVHYLMLLVEVRFGLHPSKRVEQKLARIFAHTGNNELYAWVTHMASLPSGDSEWLSLAESLTVHETYFSRDKPMLLMLRDEALAGLLERKKKAGRYTVKIWSAGCSTGEEAINVVMLLLQALERVGEALVSGTGEITPHPHWNIEVVGTDLSRQAIATAKSMQYADFAMGSFRDFQKKYLQQFFEPVSDVSDPLPGVSYYRTRHFVRRWLTFRQHNLRSANPAETECDIVICRNVLIYFEDEVKRYVQTLFNRALEPGGMLFLGGSDVQYWPELYDRQFGDGGPWYIKK